MENEKQINEILPGTSDTNEDHGTQTQHQSTPPTVQTLDEIVGNMDAHLKQDKEPELTAFMEHAIAAFTQMYEKLITELHTQRDHISEDEFKQQQQDFETIKNRFNEVINIYHSQNSTRTKISEEEKATNLELKKKIIEELKELMTKEETINQTFQDFNALQERWRSIGIVPASQSHALLETYHHYVEQFYDYIRLNKELRDLDWKKNQKEKELLCEEAERLAQHEDSNIAFKQLQLLHERWKEIGPVLKEHKESLWARFKQASDVINQHNHKFIEELKKEQENNLKAKEELIHSVEIISSGDYTTPKEWQTASAQIIEIQEQWKHIGTVPQKERNKISKRFRETCDEFFNRKRVYTKQIEKVQEENYAKKVRLCEKVEAVKDSTDWKTTTDRIISFQKEWKLIGPAPRKVSNKVWNRFRAACDEFFAKKSEANKEVDDMQLANLQAKEVLIERAKNLVLGENNEENILQLKELQSEWNKIGYVPIKHKARVQDEFRLLMNDHFNHLNINDHDKTLEQFKSKVATLNEADNREFRILQEREKLVTRIRQLESDIQVYENNIGFITTSNKSKSLLGDLEDKIAKTKQRLTLLNEKLMILDSII